MNRDKFLSRIQILAHELSSFSSPGPKQIAKFRRAIFSFYKSEGRHSLPWRHTRNPYRIFLSEVMLQQTQVSRVLPYYRNFLKNYPTIKDLARADESQVLKHWQGLGYNRRGINLLRAAREIQSRYHGEFPRSLQQLEALPCVGPYTARAVRVFSFSQREVLIETNIRSVYHYFFFANHPDAAISEREVEAIAELVAPRTRSREWNYALMDMGAFLKQSRLVKNSRAKGYRRQSRFYGSLRQARGFILKELLQTSMLSKRRLQSKIKKHPAAQHFEVALDVLLRERIITKEKQNFAIRISDRPR